MNETLIAEIEKFVLERIKSVYKGDLKKYAVFDNFIALGFFSVEKITILYRQVAHDK